MKKPDKPFLAYQVDFDETSTIVYAKTNAHARRLGCEECGSQWDYVERCRRAPQWDDLYPRGPTHEQLFDDGWWFYCIVCENHARRDDGGRFIDGEPYCVDHVDVYEWRENPCRRQYPTQSSYVWRRAA